MNTKQLHFVKSAWVDNTPDSKLDQQHCQLVFMFGSNELIIQQNIFDYVKNKFPNANIVGASTAGEIIDDSVFDDSVVVTAIDFEKSKVKCVKTNVSEHASSFEVGKHLLQQLNSDDLVTVFVVSDGTKINGSELVNGFNESNSNNVIITGGLAGDAARFSKTYTGLNELPAEGNIIAIGFYGSKLKVGHGSFGGWDEFGRERLITKSDKNILYELDGKSALDLYKEYLGPYAEELPGSALLFPLSIKIEGAEKNLVRTILSINEAEKTMTFAGNLPEGSKVRLMKANFEKLIDGSSIAAEYSLDKDSKHLPELAVLISCVGRKLILQERTFEEVQAAKNIFGNGTAITGFYSYGEISPLNPSISCELHNQTMTITTFTEL